DVHGPPTGVTLAGDLDAVSTGGELDGVLQQTVHCGLEPVGVDEDIADGRADFPAALCGRLPAPHDTQQLGVDVHPAHRMWLVQLHQRDQPLGFAGDLVQLVYDHAGVL